MHPLRPEPRGAPRFKLERKRSRGRGREHPSSSSSSSSGHRGGIGAACSASATGACGPAGAGTGARPSGAAAANDDDTNDDDEPFPIFETLSSAVVALSSTGTSNSSTRGGGGGRRRLPRSLPAMPALYATLGIYPPEPCPARDPVSVPPEELEGSGERRRRRRLALGLLKGALLVAAAVQVIRTDRRYSASLNGGSGGGGAQERAPTSAHAKASHGGRRSGAELMVGEPAGPSPPDGAVPEFLPQQQQPGTIDTLSHIMQGTSLEDDPGRVADVAVQALITLPMRQVREAPAAVAAAAAAEPYRYLEQQQRGQPPLPTPPFIRRMAVAAGGDGDGGGTGPLSLDSILGRGGSDLAATIVTDDAPAAAHTGTSTSTTGSMNPYYGGAGVGTHYVDVWVGSPAQKRSLAVMTGSDFTAFPCGVSSLLCGVIYI